MASKVDTKDIHFFVDGSGKDGKSKEGDDLREDVKETIGVFLSCLTEDAKNKYPIKAGVEKTSINDPLSPKVSGGQPAFASGDPGLISTSDSGQIFTPSVNSFLEKGKDGHDVLRSIPGSTNKFGGNTAKTPKHPISKQVSFVLRNNRFNPNSESSPFIQDGIVSNIVAGEQTRFGEYDPNGTPINFKDLGKVGRSLALRAVGEFIDGDPDSFKVGLGALIPGESQLAATKISAHQMYAKNVFGAPNKIQVGGSLNEANPLGLSDVEVRKSFGQLNSFAEPFDGYFPIGMTLLGTVLVIALRLIASALMALMGLLVKPNFSSNSVPPHGPFISGEFGRPDPRNSFLSLRDLGIINTEKDFITSVNAGLVVFFEFSGPDILRIAKSPGFYTNFVRSIIRSGNTIVNSIDDAFSPGSNPLAAVQHVVGIIDVIRSSKIISFLNIMAQLGDKAIRIRDLGFEPFGNDKIISIQDRLPENAATRVMKSRTANKTLAWRNSATPSKYLVPEEILVADNILAGGTSTNILEGVAGIGPKNIANNTQKVVGFGRSETSSGRINSDVVKEVENELEAEYVPFYFHDLRTNEIISFHAFLTSLEDNYSANYESTNAYGRIDPVRTYTNTERSLTVGFQIAATSKSDFDEMWWKINKLTTMLYPQWSQGRHVLSKFNGQDVNFVQPFSQFPTASPLIRLRVGDVVRSNYSKFGLSRLFGFGDTKKNTIGDSTETASQLEDLRKKVSEERERMLNEPLDGLLGYFGPNKKSGYGPGDVAFLMPKFEGYIEDGIAAKRSPIGRLAAASTRKLKLAMATRVKIVRAPKVETYGEHRVVYYTVEVNETRAEEQKGQWLVTHQDLYPSLKDIANKINNGLGVDALFAQQFFGGESDFMSSEKNAVVRAFESTRGRGLAGVITTMSFPEMAQQIWETSAYGSRAPKLMKVNLSFSPIHDIAPGIDHTGFNRAPLYPVGDVSKAIAGDVYEDSSGEEAFDKANDKASAGLGRKNGVGKPNPFSGF